MGEPGSQVLRTSAEHGGVGNRHRARRDTRSKCRKGVLGADALAAAGVTALRIVRGRLGMGRRLRPVIPRDHHSMRHAIGHLVDTSG